VRSRSIALLGACLLAHGAAGAEYAWQVSATLSDVETGSVVDGDNVAVAATRYFTRVDDRQGPSAVAAFLSRSSHVAIGAFDNDERQSIPFTSPSATPQTLVRRSALEGYGVSGRYVWRRSGWYAGGGLESADGEQGSNTLTANGTELRGYRVTAGKYLGDSTSLDLTVGTSDTDTEQGTSFVCSVFVTCITGFETKADDIALRAFHVGEIGRMSYSIGGGMVSTAVDLELRTAPPPAPVTPLPPLRPPIFGGGGIVAVVAPPSLTDTPFADFETYSLAAELFPTRRIGVRVAYVRWHDDPQHDYGYDVAATWFFVPRIAARVSFARTARPGFLTELRNTDTAALELLGRF
jgi:hypothetical protein